MRGGRGGAAAPPQLLGNSVFWAAVVLFLGSSNGGGGGCFSIFRRADDVTRTMSKGGGVLVNVKSGGVSQFSGGRMTSRRQCPRGGGGACEIPPPSGNPVTAPVLCKILGSQPLRPPPPPNPSGPIRLCSYMCSTK